MSGWRGLARALPARTRAGARVAAAVLVFGAAVGCGGDDGGGGRAEIGGRAPTFETFDLAGDPVKLTDYRGEVVLLNFWASWCVPCRKEFPLLAGFHARDAVTVLGVVFDDSEGNARRFMREQKATWPGLVDDGSIADAYGVARRPGIPVTVAIDAGGVVRAKHLGEADGQDLERLVEAAG